MDYCWNRICYNTLSPMDRKDSLQFQRTSTWKVTQTNMIYIVGLPARIANEELLQTQPYCGQYGEITKVAIKRTSGHRSECFSAYVTFQTEESASLAVMALRGFYIDGHKISASYGTTKYCSSFLRYGKCRKFDCLYYHKIEPEKQIHEEDNWKVFNQQQELARNYIFNNLSFIDFGASFQDYIFPSKLSVKQYLIQEGMIQSDIGLQKKLSDTSTDHSFDHYQKQEGQDDIILVRKLRRASYRKKSFFKFVQGSESPEYHSVSKHLQGYLQEITI